MNNYITPCSAGSRPLAPATGLLPMDKSLDQSSPDGERAGKQKGSA